ncbi:hypothetical protein WR25_12941 [Diploscapter pachys]|uniref:Uncharacterized protein n=1 Tax=Diploscapter pachys TaxID=2018661 RepID=A0A2A2M271_9BILA|nr:hypothetical protein WR25_12941 [Diploscapter pachys]
MLGPTNGSGAGGAGASTAGPGSVPMILVGAGGVGIVVRASTWSGPSGRIFGTANISAATSAALIAMAAVSPPGLKRVGLA